MSQAFGKVTVAGVEGQNRDDREPKIFDVFGLRLVAPAGIGYLSFGVAGGGPLGIKLGTNPLYGGCRRPHAPGKDFSALLFGDDPMLAGLLYPPSQRGVARRQENPAVRRRFHRAIDGAPRCWEWDRERKCGSSWSVHAHLE